MRNLPTSLVVGLALVCLVRECVLAQPASPRAGLPPLPPNHSPVELFRQLIAATPEEAERMLQDRTPEQRQVIKTKIQEYQITPPPLREWRLKATELRWYLTPLMRLPPESRGSLLLTVPEVDRPLVEARLRQWDQLAASEQQQMLNNELALKYVSRPTSAPAPGPAQLTHLSQSTRVQLEQAITQWRAMPEEKRQVLTARFEGFFNLTPAEQSRTLNLLTASERAALQKTIGNFAGLDPAERERCLRGLRQFSRMTQNERLAFLQGAERWKLLPDEQQQTWRRLVTKLPPLPPGAGLPPLPPGLKPAQPGAGQLQPPAGRSLAANAR